jgi:polar amino acid transport system substrate-binding protein
MRLSRREFLQAGFAVGVIAGLSQARAAPATADGRLLRISYNDDYPPYSWNAPGDVPQGILPDLLNAQLGQQRGLQVVHAGYPWRRAQAVVEQGEADAICTFASEERRQYAVFNSVPVTELRPELFYAETNPRRGQIERIDSREALAEFVLVDQQGNQWAEQHLGSMPNLQWVGGHDIIFRMVLGGRADIHVSLSPNVTRWRLKKLSIARGMVSRPAPFVAAVVPFHLGIRKNWPGAEAVLKALDGQLSLPGYRAAHDRVVKRYL